MKTLRSVKGMHDVLPRSMPAWHAVEEGYRELVERFGYQEIRTPLLEPIELFVRGIGDSTDIVEKEMYAFEDKGGDHLALRPEGTASAIRAYLQHGFQVESPQCKWYYLGPMFRRERPAKGRYRQFYQAGAELIGVAAPAADAEIIDMAVQFIESLGIGPVRVLLNSLGGEQTRPLYRKALVEHYSKHEQKLCEDCSRRLERNPLRILDCKVEGCRALSVDAPSVHDYLGEDDREHFDEVRRLLDKGGTPHQVEPTMVRGLDYYTRTIFEVQAESSALGAQTSVLGGGRYDNLVKQLGGRATPSIGFSFGIERLIMVMPESTHKEQVPLVFVAGVGKQSLDRALDIARTLRRQGRRVEVAHTGASLRSQLKKADKLGAAFAVIAGEEEAKRGGATLRNMTDGQQIEVRVDELSARLEELR